MSFIDDIKNRAKNQIKTIVLPEASDKRIIEAATIALNEAYAKIILLGDENKSTKLPKKITLIFPKQLSSIPKLRTNKKNMPICYTNLEKTRA